MLVLLVSLGALAVALWYINTHFKTDAEDLIKLTHPSDGFILPSESSPIVEATTEITPSAVQLEKAPKKVTKKGAKKETKKATKKTTKTVVKVKKPRTKKPKA